MLEEILREIEEMEYPAQGIGCGLEDESITDRYVAAAYGFAEARERIVEIICGHTEDEALFKVVASLERFAGTILKGMNKDGWIPCNVRMPSVSEEIEDECCPEFNVTIKGASQATTLKCDSEGTWFDDNGNIYPVIAWQPLPDAYRPVQKAVGEDYKQQIMGRFLRQE